MIETFFISDTHFGHANILKFEPYARPFPDIRTHDIELVCRWNSVVRKKDIVYHLGDFAMGSQGIEIAAHLNGDKRLIMGNHDCAPTSTYMKYFTKIHGSISYKDFICTHIPVASNQFHRFKGNIHGHLHSKVMKRYSLIELPNSGELVDGEEVDNRYFNVSVEHINLTPMRFSDILKQFEERQNG